jgi:ribosome-binding factor A
VGETIRQVVADALTRGELRDPRIGLVTVTRVDVSGDLSHARVYVSPQGDDAERIRALEGLRSASGFLRSMVAKVLTTRSVPELHVELDRGLQHAQRIDQLLAELRREESP